MHLPPPQWGGQPPPPSGRRKYAPATLETLAQAALDEQLFRIFEGIGATPAQTNPLDQPRTPPPLRIPVWMSHGDSVDRLPPGFSVLACTESNPVTAIANAQGMVGFQLHPEVS